MAAVPNQNLRQQEGGILYLGVIARRLRLVLRFLLGELGGFFHLLELLSKL